MEKFETEAILAIREALERLTGDTSNWKILDGAKTFTGKAKYIVCLVATTFTSFEIENVETLGIKGMTGLAIPSLTVLTAGRGKYITKFVQGAGGQVQIFE